ncbi:hypothetical protein FHX14_005076 [Rhizobium sp. BK619]|uniref:hypothetical protein n=1 Tax=Rhizobium sp. BK619 TaxID=2586989 RepID=UPI001614BE58|nr:hypothetical protein [Rhizobium sp. BK619]MBB3648847.1 hypothetical protein [Rhizobium sp. BK619]
MAPRYHRILFTSHPWIAGVVSLAIADGYVPVSVDLKYFDIGGPLLTYDTVVIGFCVTAMAICFSFSKRFSSILCKVRDGDSGYSAYEDLIFVFSWTSFIHMVSSFIMVSYYFLYGNFVLSQVIAAGFSLAIFVILFFQLYSALQFFVTIVTVHQVARLYAKFASQE